MYVNKLELHNFRNIESMTLEPCREVNIIYGDNAQGKTNLIEGLWLFTGQKSFRRAKEKELIAFDKTGANLELGFFGQGRDQYASISLGEKKSFFLNGVPLDSASKFQGEFYAVVFSPEHLTLIKDGPSLRRKFIDDAICQLMPRYSSQLAALTRVLAQRAALLFDMQRNPSMDFMLDMWDEQLAKISTAIIKARLRYATLLNENAAKIYEGLSSGAEKIEVSYLCTVQEADGTESDYTKVLEALRQSRNEDIKNAANTVGPHRDDIDITIDGVSARLFGSQGQQRSCALALKLAECEIIDQSTGCTPVVILDDVLSELDKSRRNYLLTGLKNRQVFITCCDPGYFSAISSAKTFQIENGKLVVN